MDAIDKDLVKRLCLAAGPPGAEGDVRAIVQQQLADVGPLEHDRLGSVLCTKVGAASSPRVQLDSHMDEVGFLVQNITASGYLKLVALGGWWGHVLLGQRVDILSERGTLPGVISAKPPHFLGEEERKRVLKLEAMFVDVGAAHSAEVEAAGIRVGDPVVPHAEFIEMGLDGVFSCKALDNRLGVALMCEVLNDLRSTEHPNTVIGVASVQEEVGTRGAATAAAQAQADVAVVLECTPADDLPDSPCDSVQGRLGGGPQIRFYDPTAISNRRLVQLVESIANELELPHQIAVRRSGGTDAARIHTSGSGVPTVVVGVPARYIHTHAGVACWADYAAAKDLVFRLMTRLDASTVNSLVQFS